jgi:hypothetical protein
MFRRLRKPLLLVMTAIAALALSACGDSHTKVTTGTYAGESGANAPYLDVGELKYEVQLSRQLNPANPEDAAYLEGLSPSERLLLPGQQWFAVFMQVYNNTEESLTAATHLTVSDTQNNLYTPLELGPSNLYAYRGGTIPAKGMIPALDTPAYQGYTQGALLLFKIDTVSLDNRPLELKIVSPDNPAEFASAELDV